MEFMIVALAHTQVQSAAPNVNNDVFSWVHVAQIAGAAIMVLVTLVGCLLTIMLKRYLSEAQNGLREDRKDIKADITRVHSRIDMLTTGMGDKMNTFTSNIDEKVTIMGDKIIASVMDHCKLSQSACSGLVNTTLTHQQKKLEDLRKARENSWQKQRDLNFAVMRKLDMNGMKKQDLP